MNSRVLLPRFPFACRVARRLAYVLTLSAACALTCAGQQAAAGPDLLILSNGDTLHGNLVSAAGGKLTFHTPSLGDVTVPWAQVKELHTAEKFGVLKEAETLRGKSSAGQVPVGTLDVQDHTVQVQTGNAESASIPESDAAYVVDQATLDKQLNHQPNFFTGWNGAATAGTTIVEATQNQFTASGSVGLARAVPEAAWLRTRNRTSMDFSGSYGKITQPGTPSVKTAIFHADAERDEYVSTRFFGLAQVAFDHNYAQGLALQSVYGGGMGYVAFKNSVQQLDVKATVQYESQQFLASTGAAASPSQNLFGSTFSLNYTGNWKRMALTQEAAFIPAYNTPHAYSANETDTLTFPTYKNLGFSVGTLDSYLNDPPVSVPPTKRNSFQFTMGLTYALKSKY